jgi:hypothetical protein
MSGDTIAEIGKNLNPFSWVSNLASLSTSYLGGPVEFLSANTLGLVYQDEIVVYMATLFFLLSLFVITLSDHVSMTSGLRTFFLKLHFAMVKAIRCVVMVGLFFLGKAVGSAGSFTDGLAAGRDMVVTIASLFVIQKIIEAVSMTTSVSFGTGALTPGQVIYYASFNAVAAGGMSPFIKGYSWFQTFFMVMREYLDQVTTTAFDSIIGFSREVGSDLHHKAVDNSVPSAISANNGAPRGLKYLWQAHNITFVEGSGTAVGVVANDQAGYISQTYLADHALPGFNLLSSPFYVGLVIGMWK